MTLLVEQKIAEVLSLTSYMRKKRRLRFSTYSGSLDIPVDAQASGILPRMHVGHVQRVCGTTKQYGRGKTIPRQSKHEILVDSKMY